MAELQLLLTAEERDVLLGLLDRELRDTRVESRHTDFSPDYQDQVKREEEVLRGLLDKLRRTPA